jgi:hypothetical protein
VPAEEGVGMEEEGAFLYLKSEDLEGIITISLLQTSMRKTVNAYRNRQNENQGNHLENGQARKDWIIQNCQNNRECKKSTVHHVSYHRGSEELVHYVMYIS